MIETVDNRKEWNKTVQNSDIQYFTYLYEWMDVFKECYGYEMYPLGYREKNGELTSVFPLMFDKEKKFLLSPPFGGWGGATKVEHYPDYLDYIDKLGKELKARRIYVYPTPIPSLESIFSQKGYNIESTTPYFILNVKDLSFEEFLKPRSIKKVRQNIRRAKKNGVEVIIVPTNTDSIRRFYPFYEHVMINNKARFIFPVKLFLLIQQKMSSLVNIRIAKWQDKDIAGAITFSYGDRVMMWFVVGLKDYSNLGASTLLFAHIIETAIEKNLHIVDMGPSGWNDSGFEFKRRFRADIETHINAIKGLNLYDKAYISLISWSKKQLREHKKLSQFVYSVYKKIK